MRTSCSMPSLTVKGQVNAMPVGNPAKFGRSNPLRPEDKTRQLSLPIHECSNNKGVYGRPLLSLNQSNFMDRMPERQCNFNVSISIKIKKINDNQFLVSKYGFFKFCLMFLGILKLTYLLNFIFTKCRALILTEFPYCCIHCCLVTTRDFYILKPTDDRAFLKNTSRHLVFPQKAP